MAWLDPSTDKPSDELDQTVRKATRHLRRSDDVLAGLIKQHGVYRFEPTRSYFQVMVETIISQQLSTKAASTIYHRLVDALGGKPVRPSDIIAVGDHVMTSAGLSRSKASFIRNVAEWFQSTRPGPARFARLNDEEVLAMLTDIKGIGPWSAHMFLMFALHRLDVFPIGDLGLRNAMKAHYRLRKNAPDSRYQRIAAAWKPYRTIGSLYMWKGYDG